MKTTIQISDELRAKLKLVALCKNTTYERVLREFVEYELEKLKKNGFVKSLETNTRTKIKSKKSLNKRKR